MYRVVQLPKSVVHRIGVVFVFANLVVKAQTVVVHHHKGLHDVWQNACRNQFAVEAYFLHGEVVKTIDREGI